MRLVISLVFLVLVGRLVEIQGFSGGHYSRLAAGQVTTVEHFPALRGGIYDRNGAVLAISVQRFDIVADPFIIHDAQSEAQKLSAVIDVPVTTLESDMTEDSGFVYLAKLADSRVADAVSNLDLTGINVLPENERVDPAEQLASPLIGSVGSDGEGESGLEYEYNSLLSGESGTLVNEESPSGVVLPDAPQSGSSGRDGQGIELTIDEPLQYVAERALRSALIADHAMSGTVIVMGVHTGDILAMANLVSDPQTHSVAEASQNLALTSVYEPGSVFKLVTFSAALQRGVIDPDSELTIPPSMEIDGSMFHDAESHPTEQLSATQVLAQSSNLGTIEIAEKLGATAVFDQMRKLGIGQMTGLHFPGESEGIVEPLDKWQPTDLPSTAIGQNTAVTPMQVLDMMNTVATGGEFVPPRLVQAVVAPDGSLREIKMPEEHRELSGAVTSQLTGMLEQVVADGTAPAAAVPGYTVAGKTGTAQIPNPDAPGYLSGQYMATFTGFAPAQDPQVSAIVVLDRPTPIFGGTVAAPVFSQVMAYALQRFGVASSPSQESTASGRSISTGAIPAAPPVSYTEEASSTPPPSSTTTTAAQNTSTSGSHTDPGGGSPGTIGRSAGQSARSP